MDYNQSQKPNGFAENLRKLRGEKHVSQNTIAAYLKVDRSTYSCYETGKTEPSLKSLTMLARYFGVSIDRLLESKPSKKYKAK